MSQVPAALPAVLAELNQAILRNQPPNVVLFCYQYFQRKLLETHGNGKYLFIHQT
jgi:hypothetical protein